MAWNTEGIKEANSHLKLLYDKMEEQARLLAEKDDVIEKQEIELENNQMEIMELKTNNIQLLKAIKQRNDEDALRESKLVYFALKVKELYNIVNNTISCVHSINGTNEIETKKSSPLQQINLESLVDQAFSLDQNYPIDSHGL